MNEEMREQVVAIRKRFPVLERKLDGRPIVYLDNAATSLKPRSVIDAVTEYYECSTANIHRGKHYLSEEVSNRYEEARYQVSLFLNCQGNEVVFVRNATEALNLVAQGLGLAEDDLVVGFLNSHHSHILPWRAHATLWLVRTDASGQVDLDHYAQLLRARPKVVAITHCSNVTGIYAPLPEMVAMAKEAGALVVVDAAQSLPHRKIDLATMPIDFLAFSSHKMLGPSGLGCLFGRKAHLDALTPMLWGGGMVDWVDIEGSALRKTPHRFEAGTPAIEGALGFARAIDLLDEIGADFLEAHDHSLSACLLDRARERPYMEVLGAADPGDRAAILTFRIAGGKNLSEVARILSDTYGIMCRSGHLCSQPFVSAFAGGEVLRASAYVYNTEDEIDHLFRSLDQIVSFL